jgi:transposase
MGQRPTSRIASGRTARPTCAGHHQQSVELAYVDQGYTDERAAEAAEIHGIALEVVKLPEAKECLVLLPRCRVVERSFGWMARFHRLTRDYSDYRRR